MQLELVLKALSPRGYVRLVCAGHAILGLRKPSHQNTPLKLTALSTDTVEVTDPTHPLYGLTFPLIGITTKQHLGRVCVVWLYPGVERVIPIAATNLGGSPVKPSPCRLCVQGLHALLAAVASWENHPQEDNHSDSTGSSDTAQPTTRLTVAGAGGVIPAPDTEGSADHSTSAPVDEFVGYNSGASASDPAAHLTGDAS